MDSYHTYWASDLLSGLWTERQEEDTYEVESRVPLPYPFPFTENLDGNNSVVVNTSIFRFSHKKKGHILKVVSKISLPTPPYSVSIKVFKRNCILNQLKSKRVNNGINLSLSLKLLCTADRFFPRQFLMGTEKALIIQFSLLICNKRSLADIEIYWITELGDLFLKHFSVTYYITFFSLWIIYGGGAAVSWNCSFIAVCTDY